MCHCEKLCKCYSNCQQQQQQQSSSSPLGSIPLHHHHHHPLLDLSIYIHLNPIQVFIVTHPKFRTIEFSPSFRPIQIPLALFSLTFLFISNQFPSPFPPCSSSYTTAAAVHRRKSIVTFVSPFHSSNDPIEFYKANPY